MVLLVQSSGKRRLINLSQGVTKRAGRKKDGSTPQAGSGGAGQSQARRAIFESNKKKEVGVSDLTLITKITNEAINDNLKQRFENAEIYVSDWAHLPSAWELQG